MHRLQAFVRFSTFLFLFQRFYVYADPSQLPPCPTEAPLMLAAGSDGNVRHSVFCRCCLCHKQRQFRRRRPLKTLSVR